MVAGEPDFTARTKALVDLWYIKGVTLKNPTIAASVPMSIENPAIAYNSAEDRFYVEVESWAAGTLTADVSDRWARLVGQVDLYRVLGATLAHSNPVIVRLTTGSTWLDPTQIRALTSSDVITAYGSQAQPLLQRASTYDALVQLRHSGVEIDPRAVRALTSSDVVTAYGSLAALQQRPTTQDLYVQIRHQGSEKDPTATRALTSADVVTVADLTKEAGFCQQIDVTFAGSGNSAAIRTPAGGKKIRLKLLVLELSTAVALGYRWAAAGTIRYVRTTAGPMAINFLGANDAGAADEAFYLNASGAGVVKGFFLGDEI